MAANNEITLTAVAINSEMGALTVSVTGPRTDIDALLRELYVKCKEVATNKTAELIAAGIYSDYDEMKHAASYGPPSSY